MSLIQTNSYPCSPNRTSQPWSNLPHFSEAHAICTNIHAILYITFVWKGPALLKGRFFHTGNRIKTGPWSILCLDADWVKLVQTDTFGWFTTKFCDAQRMNSTDFDEPLTLNLASLRAQHLWFWETSLHTDWYHKGGVSRILLKNKI